MIENKHLKVLADIQTRANQKFNKQLFVDKPHDEVIKKVFDETLKMDIPDWKRKYLVIMRKELLKPQTMVDEHIGAVKDKWVEGEIRKAVKKGLLPKKI